MQTIRWLSFCVSNPLTRTCVHFCPAAKNIAAPYPINCQLTLFGGGLSEPLSVVVEGARMRQPDGMRLEDAFPVLRAEASGIFGLGVELLSPQGRVDLSASDCLIELHSNRFSSRFRPKQVDIGEHNAGQVPELLCLKDSLNVTSVVIVNGSDQEFSPCFKDLGSSSQDFAQPLEPLGALSVREMSLDVNGAKQVECGLGKTIASAFSIAEDPPQNVVGYIVYRDTETKEPMSVSAL